MGDTVTLHIRDLIRNPLHFAIPAESTTTNGKAGIPPNQQTDQEALAGRTGARIVKAGPAGTFAYGVNPSSTARRRRPTSSRHSICHTVPTTVESGNAILPHRLNHRQNNFPVEIGEAWLDFDLAR